MIWLFSVFQPWGDILELIASELILIPATVWAGSMLAFGLVGAIVMHLTIIGIEVQGDGGRLFI
jgi:hypothetical protein